MLAELQEKIVLPTGFMMRPCTLDDVTAVVNLINDCQEPLTGQRPQTVEDQVRGWTEPNFDLENSARLVFNEDGRLVGYISVWDTDPIPVRIWVYGRVHPEFEGLGIGTALRIWGEQRARQALARTAADLQVTMVSGVLEQHTAAHELLKSRGMQEVRSFYQMSIALDGDIPEPVVPEGITIKAWSEVEDTVTLRDIAWADYEGFRDHYGFTEQPFETMLEMWEHWVSNDETIERELWFLPMTANGEIVGVSLCLNKSHNIDNWGYVDSLAVLPQWRRKGLALALLHHSFRAFKARGYERVDLHVDAQSLTGATRVYERAGMHVSERHISYELLLRDGRDISRKEL